MRHRLSLVLPFLIVGSCAANAGAEQQAVASSAAPRGSFVPGYSNDTTLIGAGYTQLAASNQQSWKATATAGAPSARFSHTAMWTGSRMIVWGGFDQTTVFNSGGIYDPVSDSWTATTTTGAPEARWLHTAVWTGSKMIVWGGSGLAVSVLGTGGLYDPVSDSWTATTTTGAPTARVLNTAVWTGSKMIVWGGYDETGSPLNSGGLYDPSGDSWTATTTSGAPAGRGSHTAVWTGSRMIVWGGGFDVTGASFNSGGLYDPSGDSWTATTTSGAPTGRTVHTAVWTGSKMIVWGGFDGATHLNSGGLYDPSGDSWNATTLTGAPTGRSVHSAVWLPTARSPQPVPFTGGTMIVWGGFGDFSVSFNSGGRLTTRQAPVAFAVVVRFDSLSGSIDR